MLYHGRIFFMSYMPTLEQELALINNSAGFQSEESITREDLQELKDEIKKLHSTALHKSSFKKINSARPVTKGKARRDINQIKKTTRLGRKEKMLLEILADLEPHSLKSLTREIETKACKHLKGRLQKKLKNAGYKIQTDKANGFQKDSFYKLIYSPLKKNARKRSTHK